MATKANGRGKAASATTPPVRVAFAGQIKSIKTMTDAAGDKAGTITIAFRPEGSIIADLDKIHQPEKSIYAVVMDRVE